MTPFPIRSDDRKENVREWLLFPNLRDKVDPLKEKRVITSMLTDGFTAGNPAAPRRNIRSAPTCPARPEKR
jgi:hypothetical protein